MKPRSIHFLLIIIGISSFFRMPIAAATDADASVWPSAEWRTNEPSAAGMDSRQLTLARDYALTGNGSGIITRHGKLVLSWGNVQHRYDLKSTTKSIGVTALGLAIKDRKLQLTDIASQYHPSLGTPPEENRKSGWLKQITLRHLATQTAGFSKPGGFEPLLFKPGSKWHYSDGGPNWLAECLTNVYEVDLRDLMFQRVFTPLGITSKDLTWRSNSYRPKQIAGVTRREFGSGISANVDAMARIGYLYLRDGKWKSEQIIPQRFVELARSTQPGVIGLPEHDADYGNASDHYGLLWWNNADGTIPGVPRDAFWSWGLYDSLILVVPSLDIVVSRAGHSWQRKGWNGHYDVLAPFFQPIVKSVLGSSESGQPPYPRSSVIKRIEWASADTIIRKARGSDNWPMTSADDGDLYTAYGDGHGFEPHGRQKLSLGLARVSGPPQRFVGTNIPSESGEQLGDGDRGLKASGMLMVDGVLYMWTRNAGNARLAWSTDRAHSWIWCDWKMTSSFGYPTFLNFGPNYFGARDDYVYTYSPDTDDAYSAADGMVLARVPKQLLRDRKHYEFFQQLAPDGTAVWTKNIAKRGSTFIHKRKCYRSAVTYNAGLKRYLWCQVLPPSDKSRGPRFDGGFGVYDAPEPWGPWTTVFFSDRWDVGPGETNSFPTKWMSADGRTMHLVFSGDDCFSVRRATLSLK